MINSLLATTTEVNSTDRLEKILEHDGILYASYLPLFKQYTLLEVKDAIWDTMFLAPNAHEPYFVMLANLYRHLELINNHLSCVQQKEDDSKLISLFENMAKEDLPMSVLRTLDDTLASLIPVEDVKTRAIVSAYRNAQFRYVAHMNGWDLSVYNR